MRSITHLHDVSARILLIAGVAFAGLTTGPLATASPVVFMFHDGSATVGAGLAFDDATGSTSHATSGVTLTAEALLNDVATGTVMNGASDGFGVNATGAGDSTTRLDNTLGIESLVFSFDVAGTLDLIDLRYIEETANEAVLSFAGGNTYQLNAISAFSLNDDFVIGESFAAGQLITLSISGLAGAGENFSLESLSITPIPEPSTYAFWTGAALLGVALHRRRRFRRD